ncbi:MAG: aminoglycoside phosphotransferase family protein [Rhodobacteraceae bacterium]|nr:aminoglycoside phosphotransferase family protein [Paracoccaceae bacterium]
MTTPPPVSLLHALAAQDLAGRDTRWTAMGGGRTNRVWCDAPGERVLKLYRETAVNALFGNAQEREAQAMRQLSAVGLAPRLIAEGRCADGPYTLAARVPGRHWSRGARQVGALLARLHLYRGWRGLPEGPDGSRAIAAQTARLLSGCVDAAALADLRPTVCVPPGGRLSLCHGDPVPANIIAGDNGLTLIDWQCPSRGDPCDDLGLFLSPAMQKIYRGHPLSAEEEHAFLDGYGQSAVAARLRRLRPWYHWRMAVYCQWRAERGAADYADALPLEIAALRRCDHMSASRKNP